MAKRSVPITLLVLLLGSYALFPEAAGAGEAPSAGPATDPPALRPSTDVRRLVVMLADNGGTETTDLLVPHGILKRSGAVDILIVATGEGPVELMPALTIMPDLTVEEFEKSYPRGADAVIVPAFHSRGSRATTAFLRGQAALGAMVVSICEGSEPVARAGLFDSRAATTHWFARNRMIRRYPEAHWVENARYVVDGPVMSSSGVSASVPATLELLEILAGGAIARETARSLGLEGWSDDHDSHRFSLEPLTIAVALGNILRSPRRERLYAEVSDGLDGVALALQADAWSRTYRSRLIARSLDGRVLSREGVTFLTSTERRSEATLTAASGAPMDVLDTTLVAISSRYGERTAELVALQLEYLWP